MIPVTKPFLPPAETYKKYIDDIWQRNWLTNNGPLVNELEINLKKYLGLDHLLFLNNGTIALQIAIKALNLTGEIITTPFSYVATTSSIIWEGCQAVFVDVDEETLNIDPSKIEQAITPNTSAILATHVYGNPCDIEKISTIAKKHNLKVIYDAAHCFGTYYQGKSVFAYGDITTTSFHATKLFHTIEGGAVFTSDANLLKKMAYLRNFGHSSAETFGDLGINGKNSEFHAAMGLCNLNYISSIIESREKQSAIYDKWLKNKIRKPKITIGTKYNFSYYPVLFETEQMMFKVLQALNDNWIYPRRYFFPSLATLPYINTPNQYPITDSACKRVLCLPLYFDLSEAEQELITRIILRNLQF